MSCTTSTTSTILEHCAPSHTNNKKKQQQPNPNFHAPRRNAIINPHLPQFTKISETVVFQLSARYGGYGKDKFKSRFNEYRWQSRWH